MTAHFAFLQQSKIRTNRQIDVFKGEPISGARRRILDVKIGKFDPDPFVPVDHQHPAAANVVRIVGRIVWRHDDLF